MKFWSEIKAWLITNLNLAPESTDAEVHQAILETTKQAKPEEKKETPIPAATPTAIMVPVQDFLNMQSKIAELEAKMVQLAKKPSASVAGETGEQPVGKTRAYMTTKANSHIDFNK